VLVDENGTEAAAATAVVMPIGIPSLRISVSRPFVFLIRDTETGAVLFLGRILNPLG
jgi:serpin B